MSHAVLYPFETFREPFVVLGLVDQSKYDFPDSSESGEAAPPSAAKRPLSELNESLSQLRENYPNALVHRLLLTGVREEEGKVFRFEDALPLGPNTNTKTLLSDIAAVLLPEMTGLAKSFQALQNFPSPLSQDQDRQTDDFGMDVAGAGRRGSLRPTTGSSQSLQDKTAHRMSMPAHLMSSASQFSSDGSRPGTPTGDGRSTPATTFDDIPGAVPPNVSARISTPPGTDSSRDSSKDRNSLGFGSGPVSDRNRMKQQGRLGSILGSLYLQSGLWGEALRELTDSAIKARSCSDHLWHAKALENLAICMLLLASNGVGFKIPDICYPASTRPLAARGALQSPTANVTEAAKPEEIIEAMRSLYDLLPELIHMVRDTYRRTMDIPGEGLPQFAYSEINIRFARLFISLSDRGSMDAGMNQLMQGDPRLVLPKFHRGRAFVRQTNDILQHAIPRTPDFLDISMLDTVSILGAVASSYSALDMPRKSALVLQEFLDCLVPGLVQARKVGAAEAGMHPAAGIANLQSQVQQPRTPGMRLDDILRFFECIDLMPALSHDDQDPGDKHPAKRTVLTNVDTKLNLLRRCVKVCEALPDFNGILKCTAQLFALAGPGSAPPLSNPDVFIMLPPDEQAMLSGNFYRTSDLIDNLGLPKDGGTYWDNFLVRGIEVSPVQASREMIPRRMADFGITGVDQSSVTRGPFLHDAFAQKNKGSSSRPILVSGETCTFYLTLQNLYDFEVYIDSLELVTSMVDFEARTESLRISPRCAQVFPVSGIPNSSGNLRITGCKVAAKGCNARVFDIVSGHWYPQEPMKILPSYERGTKSSDSPKSIVLETTVLEPQPLLSIADLTLSQRAIDVMEGERRKIKLSLCDRTSSASVNFLKITPQDNIKLYLQNALKERDLQPSLRHEMERQVFQNPVLRCISGEERQQYNPKETANFEFEVFGKPGLTHGSIQIDYANLADVETKVSFFTRVIDIPFTIAVKPSIRLLSCHISPLPQDPMGVLGARSSNSWMTIDFKNASAIPLKLAFKQTADGCHHPKWLPNGEQEELIAPGRMTSHSRTTPKFLIENPHAIIPSLDPTKERQFVLRQSGGAPIDERDERERFWFSASLVDSLAATWTEPETGKSGTINLHDISLSSEEVDLLRLDDVTVTWAAELSGHLAEISNASLKVSNKGKEALRLEAQLYRTIGGFTDRVAGSHVDTQLLSVLMPGSEIDVVFDCTFENRGHHVFVPSVVEREHGDGDIGRPLRTWSGETKYVNVR